MIIDDFSGQELIASIGTSWRAVSDRVMGGVSQARLTREVIAGRRCLRLTGDVRLDNNGGFIQMALDLAPDGATLDASAYRGLRLLVRGNGERYGVHLRTPDALRPWQSYRAQLATSGDWQVVHVPFDAFEPHRLEPALDRGRLRRLGLVAIGRAFAADLAVGEVALIC